MGYSESGVPGVEGRGQVWEGRGRGRGEAVRWPGLDETSVSPCPASALGTLGRAEKEIFTVMHVRVAGGILRNASWSDWSLGRHQTAACPKQDGYDVAKHIILRGHHCVHLCVALVDQNVVMQPVTAGGLLKRWQLFHRDGLGLDEGCAFQHQEHDEEQSEEGRFHLL